MARRKISLVPVSKLTPEAVAEMEKSGAYVGRFTEAELQAKREVWKASLRWPLHGVYSEDFAALPEHERLHQLALGNVQSAKSLCIELGEHPERLSWARGSVVYYLTLLAAELFLKACLLRAGRRFPTHEVSELQDAFAETFPKQKSIQTMWDINLRELATFGPEPGDERMPARDDQIYRYFADRQGRPPDGVEYSFAPAVFIPAIERLEADMAQVWRSLVATPASTRRSAGRAGLSAAGHRTQSRARAPAARRGAGEGG